MTNEEKARELAQKYGGCYNDCCSEEVYNAAMEIVKWKDEKLLEVVNGLLTSDDYLMHENAAEVLEDFQYVLKTGDFSILEAYYTNE